MPLQLPDGALSNARDPPPQNRPGEAFGRNSDRSLTSMHTFDANRNPFKFLPCDRDRSTMSGEASRNRLDLPSRIRNLNEPGQASRNRLHSPTPSFPTRSRSDSSLEPLGTSGEGVPILDLVEGYIFPSHPVPCHARSRHAGAPVEELIERSGPAVVTQFRSARDQDIGYNAAIAQFQRDMAAGLLGVPAGTALSDVEYMEVPGVQADVPHLDADIVDRTPIRAHNTETFRHDMRMGLLPQGTVRRDVEITGSPALADFRTSLVSGVIVQRNAEGAPSTVYPRVSPFHR